jgi:hypothetical protein
MRERGGELTGEEDDTGAEEDGEEDLKGDWESPLCRPKKASATVSVGRMEQRWKKRQGKRKKERERTEAPPRKTKDMPKSIQYEIKVPPATMEASMQTRNPRLCDLDVSATQEGIVDVLAPFPRPQMIYDKVEQDRQ